MVKRLLAFMEHTSRTHYPAISSNAQALKIVQYVNLVCVMF